MPLLMAWGLVLSHTLDDGEHPVAFTSRTLIKAERNYSQIKKEALALVYRVKKFHKYLYGRCFTLITDHKPLLSILSAKAEVPSVAAQRGPSFYRLTLITLNSRAPRCMLMQTAYHGYQWKTRKTLR